MKRKHDSSHLTELFLKAGLIAALASVLLLPTTVRTIGNAAQPISHMSGLKEASTNGLRLPPIRYLETMPWLIREQTKGLKIDTLLAPKFEMVGPTIAATGSDGRIWSPSGPPSSIFERKG